MLVNNVVVQAKGEERIKVVQVGDLPKRKKRDGRSGLLIAIVTKNDPLVIGVSGFKAMRGNWEVWPPVASFK